MILITGGTRSGKSEFAEQLAAKSGSRFLYMATAKITDDEMAERVRRHRSRRSDAWHTHEGYVHLDRVLKEAEGQYDGILLDSVSTMVTNMIFEAIGDVDWEHFDYSKVDYKAIEDSALRAFEDIGQAAKKTDAPLVIVTDEIGLGVIPDTCLGRAFRDILGIVNQLLAKLSDEVYFIVSGIPVKIKDESKIKGRLI